MERVLTLQLTGNHFRVSADAFPHLHEIVSVACETLDLPKHPEIYMGGISGLNAITAGIDRPIVAVSTSLVDALTDEELSFVVAHELGHIKSGHVLYRQIAEFLPLIVSQIETMTLGLGKLFSAGIRVALRSWERTSELTADRAGLLATQNPDAAFSALMKLAGLPQKYFDSVNTQDFIAQAREFRAMDGDTMNWVLKALTIANNSHPWTVARAHELLDWIDSGEYSRILAAGQAMGSRALGQGNRGVYCNQCGSALKADAAFCNQCGSKRIAS
ncbi:MAG: M48 family metallopeptidase [Polyangiaceae bacterium]